MAVVWQAARNAGNKVKNATRRRRITRVYHGSTGAAFQGRFRRFRPCRVIGRLISSPRDVIEIIEERRSDEAFCIPKILYSFDLRRTRDTDGMAGGRLGAATARESGPRPAR